MTVDILSFYALCELINQTSVSSNSTGVFPDYPDEEDGGSALIFAEKNPQQVNIEMNDSPDVFKIVDSD